jgi:hypothetical protein
VGTHLSTGDNMDDKRIKCKEVITINIRRADYVGEMKS